LLSLEDLAQALKVSPGYASRVLKRSAGFSFSTFLNRVRVARAVALMNDPTVRLGEVAELVGYSSQHYFSRAFKRVLGVSPGKARDGELES
jgi:two-component system response regulator YesN